MTNNLDLYLQYAKENLCCNMSEEDRSRYYVCYEYNDADIDANKEYFCKCMEDDLSPYKALLFFHDYLETNEAKD